MKEQILKLRAEGKSYNEIKKELNCSKGTIAYHCGKQQKEKTHIRNNKNRKLKLENPDYYLRQRIISLKFKKSISNTKKRCSSIIKYTEQEVQDFIDNIVNNPICYLTGDKIDLTNRKSYNFDHVIPLSKGGTSSLDNIKLTTKKANFVKTDLTLEELVDICKKIIKISSGETWQTQPKGNFDS